MPRRIDDKPLQTENHTTRKYFYKSGLVLDVFGENSVHCTDFASETGVESPYKNTLFKTELAFDEFKHLLELDYKKEWFNEVKQIIQVSKNLRKSTQNLRIC